MPLSEFHFAFCGIATVAATIGYACARRAVHSLASPNEPSKADVEAGPPEERSLKRKLDDSDEYDVDAEEQSRPMKRNRTPPADRHEPDEDFNQEWEVVVAPPPYEEAAGFRQTEEPVRDHITPPQGDPPSIEQNVTPVREPTPPSYPETSPRPEEKGVEAGRCSTPQPPQVTLSPNEPETPPARPATPPKPSVPAKTKPINAFSAFSGSSSPFTSYTNASGASPFALSGQSIKTTPAWRRDDQSESDVFGLASSTNALATSPNDALSSATAKSSARSQNKNALGVSSETQFLVKSTSCLTGEEGETAEAELKGVKLFIKRGRNEFTDGIYGHVKILTRESTPQNIGDEDPQRTEVETNSRTRLLFRRDPLGQVSMNVALQSTVRCHFDAAENILRIITMEPLTTDGKKSKEDVVIYALKPGRAQKADFQSFAKTLCNHEGLKSRLVASSAAPASGDAAAS